MDLFDLIGFADRNKIDYKTDVYKIIEAYNALEKVKNPIEVVQEHTPYDSSKWTEDKYNIDETKNTMELGKEKLLRWYKNCCFFSSIKISEDMERHFYEGVEFFESDNALMLDENITYIGKYKGPNFKGMTMDAKVFVDDTLKPNTVIVNFWEERLEPMLKSYTKDVNVEHNVCR